MQDRAGRVVSFYYRAAILGLLIILTTAAMVSMRLAYGSILSRGRTGEDIVRAVKLDPWNADYRAHFADDLERQHENPTEALLRATELDPLNSANWIRRGIRAEMQGRTDAAEHLYREAARVDAHFAPRITLMNFYFRQGEVSKFWKWARLAFERSYGNPTGAFELCWRVQPDAGAIIERAIPRDPALLQQFLQFVSARTGDVAAAPVADELLKTGGTDAAHALMEYCDRLVLAGQFDRALEIRLGLFRRGVLTDGAARGNNLLTNAAFEAPFQRLGFNWKWAEDPEIHLVAGQPHRGFFSVSFSGRQAASCEALSQIVPVQPGGRYRMTLEYRTTPAATTGVYWNVGNAAAPGETLVAESLDPSDKWKRLVSVFESGGSRFLRVSLQYRRAPGTVRYEGDLQMRGLSLSRVTDER
jgi:hypothetical protein